MQEGNKSVQDFLEKFSDVYPETIGEIVNFNFSDNEESNKTQFNDCLWLVYKTNLLGEKQNLINQLETASSDRKKELMQKVMHITQLINNRSIE